MRSLGPNSGSPAVKFLAGLCSSLESFDQAISGLWRRCVRGQVRRFSSNSRERCHVGLV